MNEIESSSFCGYVFRLNADMIWKFAETRTIKPDGHCTGGIQNIMCRSSEEKLLETARVIASVPGEV
jgi:hypothetical protein